MDPRYAARYRQLYEQHWWWRAREALIQSTLEQLAPAAGFGRILDVGCGDGLLLPLLRRFGQPEGIEPDAASVSAEGRASGTIHIAPFDQTFRPATPYGLVLLLDVLEHLDDDRAALRQAGDLLAPGGVLLITVPAFEMLWTAHDDINHHRRRYTKRGLRGRIVQAGLEVSRLDYFFRWLFPLKLLVRLKERIAPQPARIPQVPGRFWNRLFYDISRLEQRTWGHLRLGFGSSILAVCRPASQPRRPA
jgi:SAM-dependent methyltransferase